MSEQIEDNQERYIKDAVQQFVDAQLEGQKPDLDEFVKRFPGCEHQIRRMILNIQKIDTLFDSIVQADEGDFEDTVSGYDLVGQKIGHFEVREMIGRGGMGIVYLAHDIKLERTVAIKSIPPELMDNAIARTRFQREAKLLASLNHPNIAVIHDIIEQDDDSGYLVLEYVPGQTLAEHIAHEPLKLEEALSIAQQIAEAVSAAHEKGVVHRDLKPGNIKLLPDGRVKILDFGLAKTSIREGAHIEITSTEPGHIIGTPAYMSPEQARGKPTDNRTDIWSFGCIMYQMLTGHSPFESDTATDTLARIIERQPDWDLLLNETPENIRILIQRCLEKDQEQRLGSIEEAAIEISETLIKPATASPVRLRRIAMIIGVVVIGIMSGITLKFIPKKEIQPSPKEIRLVVLPFENLGPAADSYFATGLTDEVTTRLAGVHGLRVYKNRDGVATQIIKELGVDYILEGTIQRARRSDPNSPVRIRPKLIRVSDDSLVWAKPYDDDMRDVLQIQSDLAEEIAQALDIALLEPERRAIASRPTENTLAYEYYLRGNEYYNRSNLKNDIIEAIRMYDKAVEQDPTFALAYARLSMVHAKMYWFPHDRSEQRLAMAEQAVNKALQLNPGLPETHVALGYYHYWGHRDYDLALEQFDIARKSRPNDSLLLSGIGWVQRRQGKFEQASANLVRACELDPLSALLMEQLGETFLLLRDYPQAEQYFDRAIKLDPNGLIPYTWKARLYLLWEGSTKKARAVFEKAPKSVTSTDNPFIDSLVTLDVYDEKYQEALDRLSLKSEDIDHVFYFIPKALRYARIYSYMKKQKLAETYYDEARSILESKIKERPEDSRLHSSLGIALAGLGRKEDAIREGKKGVDLLPVTKDAWAGLYRVEALARIYVMVDEHDTAIDKLEELLSKPGMISRPLLRLEPKWDPLRDHPRFQKLIEQGIKD